MEDYQSTIALIQRAEASKKQELLTQRTAALGSDGSTRYSSGHGAFIKAQSELAAIKACGAALMEDEAHGRPFDPSHITAEVRAILVAE